jgi:hydrogenase nickel incorporation protein HypA/HybF
MHETSLARRVLAEVLARAGGRTVRRVRGSIAEDEALDAEALRFHFRAHARGTPAEAAELEFELEHVSASCRACHARFFPEHHVHVCPRCASTDVRLDRQTGVYVESIDVEEP